MGRLVKGDLVVVPFPFADLPATKRRPALVVTRAGGEDLFLAQITGRAIRDEHAIPLGPRDCVEGGLRVPSNVRPNHLFTADSSLVLYRPAKVRPAKLAEVVAGIKRMLDAD